MKISLSSVIDGVIPAVITGAGSGRLSEITNADHSLLYTGADASDLELSFGAVTCRYVGISGHNTASPAAGQAGTVTLLDGITEIQTVALTRSHNLMFTFETEQVFTDMRVRFSNSAAAAITITYIAAGDYFDVPNGGEQSGYKRNWLNRPLVQRSTYGLNSAPIAVIRDRKPPKGTLSIPNSLTAFSQGTWQTFVGHIQLHPFFIKENDELPESTVLAFEPKFKAPTAHASTRELNKLSINYSVYIGL